MLNVLIVEDNDADAQLIAGMLAFGVDGHEDLKSCRVTTLADAVLMACAVDVVILDLALPDSKGLATFRALVKMTSVPIVVVTGLNDTSVGIQAIRDGAQDYLVKGSFNNQTLVRAVLYAVERHRRETIENHFDAIVVGMNNFKQSITTLKDEVKGTSEVVHKLCSSPVPHATAQNCDERSLSATNAGDYA